MATIEVGNDEKQSNVSREWLRKKESSANTKSANSTRNLLQSRTARTRLFSARCRRRLAKHTTQDQLTKPILV